MADPRISSVLGRDAHHRYSGANSSVSAHAAGRVRWSFLIAASGTPRVCQRAGRRGGATVREFAAAGIHRQVLTRLAASGQSERVVRGIYRLPVSQLSAFWRSSSCRRALTHPCQTRLALAVPGRSFHGTEPRRGVLGGICIKTQVMRCELIPNAIPWRKRHFESLSNGRRAMSR